MKTFTVAVATIMLLQATQTNCRPIENLTCRERDDCRVSGVQTNSLHVDKDDCQDFKMPKGNNGNPDCKRRSNCCPGGIEDHQQPVEKQLSSSPEESSRKIGAAESVQDKVEVIELKSRASQDVPEKAEQPKKPVNNCMSGG